MTSFPPLSAEQLAHSHRLTDILRTEIAACGGWISFSRYMALALYAPGLGYYSAGKSKFGAGGDFVTAPEISVLFARTLARQVSEVMAVAGGDLLELGAGSGAFAARMLPELQRLGRLPRRYLILEVSAHLRALQQETLAHVLPQDAECSVDWIDALPETFSGLVLGNEVLDALPVHVVAWRESGIFERGVIWDGNGLAWQERILPEGVLRDRAVQIAASPGTVSEIGLAAESLVASLARMLRQGALLWVDYGFPRREYYHPQRANGTLMCHYRHRAHADPFFYPGMQDITAHVDFTAIAAAGVAQGLQLLGYTSQAQFLINSGVTELLAEISPADVAAYLPLAAQAQKLLSPAEMGELFKVMVLGRDVPAGSGFARGDRGHTL